MHKKKGILPLFQALLIENLEKTQLKYMVIPYFSKVSSVSDSSYIIDGSNLEFRAFSCLDIEIADLINNSVRQPDNKLEDGFKSRFANCH